MRSQNACGGGSTGAVAGLAGSVAGAAVWAGEGSAAKRQLPKMMVAITDDFLKDQIATSQRISAL